MRNKILKFGLIGGAIISGLMLLGILLMNSGLSFAMGEVLGYTSMLLAFSAVFIGVKNIRDKELEGQISFGKALKVGLLMVLIVSVIYVITWMIFVQVNGSEFMDTFFQEMVNEVKNSGKPADVIATEVEEMYVMMEWYKNPFVQAGVTFLEIFPVGLLVSLVTAGILRKNKQN